MRKKVLISTLLFAMMLAVVGCSSSSKGLDSSRITEGVSETENENKEDVPVQDNIGSICPYTDEELAEMPGSIMDISYYFIGDYVAAVRGADSEGTVYLPKYMTSKDTGSEYRVEGLDDLFHGSNVDSSLNYDNVKKIVVPNTVTSIYNCFLDMPYLEEVVLPAGLKSIDLSFRNCPNLKRVVIPGDMEMIRYSFSSLGNLESIEFLGGVDSIDGSFSSCKKITEVSFPDTIKEIYNSFDGCSALASIEFDTSKTAICGKYVFSGTQWYSDLVSNNAETPVVVNGVLLACPISTDTFVLPGGVNTVAGCAFTANECKVRTLILTEVSEGVKFNKESLGGSLEEVFFNHYIEYLDDYAFYNSDIKKVEFLEGVGKIGSYAFALTDSLTNMVLPEGLTEIGDYAFDGSDIETILLPESLELIGEYAFLCCSDLKAVIIPSKIKEIKNNTFQGCSYLTSVTLPDGIEKLEYMAFGSCSSLSFINSPTSLKEVDGDAFYKCSSLENKPAAQ